MICSGHAMQTLCYFVLYMNVSINIPSTIDNIVIKSHRRALHNKNCDFLNSCIIFLLPLIFHCIVMNMIVAAVYSSSQQLVQIEKEIKNKYDDLCLKNSQG